MSRPIRIEFPDALYHVTARGDRREDIFDDDQDRLMFLSTLEQAVKQFNWICHAWCLMDNLAQFAKRRSLAQRRYAQFVAEGNATASPWSDIKGQVFLGDDQFVQRMQTHLQADKDDVQIPLAQRRPLPPSLAKIECRAKDRNSAILAAYATGAYSYQQIADHFGMHFTTVGRIVRRGN